jgi:hypothetical protein
MEGLDKGGQGPTSGCCATEEEEEDILKFISLLLETPAIRACGQALSHCCKVQNSAKLRQQNENKYGVNILNKVSYISNIKILKTEMKTKGLKLENQTNLSTPV